MNGNSVLKLLAVAGVMFFAPLHGEASRHLIGEPAPDFGLKSSTGENLRLSEYRGEVVLLTFWSSRCGSCMRQLPAVRDLKEQYEGSGFRVLSVTIDDDTDHAMEMADDLSFTSPVLFDSDKDVSRLYKLRSLPTVVVIDRHGTVRYVHSKYRKTDRHDYRREVTELLEE